MGKPISLQEVKARLPDYVTVVEETFVNTVTKAKFVDTEYGEFEAIVGKVMAGAHVHPNRKGKNGRVNYEEMSSRMSEFITIKKETYQGSDRKCVMIDSEYGEFIAIPGEVARRGSRHPDHKHVLTSKRFSKSYEESQAMMPDYIEIIKESYINFNAKCQLLDKEHGIFINSPKNVYCKGTRHPNSKAKRIGKYSEQRKIHRTEYGRKRRLTDPQFKMIGVLRNRINKFVRLKNNRMLDLIGCTKQELVAHIESLFLPGMTWNNHGLRGWHIDHIKPLSKFNLLNEEELREATHYKNLQPLWAKDNILKKDN